MSDDRESGASLPQPQRYETRDVSARSAAIVLVILLVGAVLMHAALAYGLRRARDQMGGRTADDAFRVGTAEVVPPRTLNRLETSEYAPLDIYLKRERALLEEYRWVDPEHGVARIPVERAMEINAKMP